MEARVVEREERRGSSGGECRLLRSEAADEGFHSAAESLAVVSITGNQRQKGKGSPKLGNYPWRAGPRLPRFGTYFAFGSSLARHHSRCTHRATSLRWHLIVAIGIRSVVFTNVVFFLVVLVVIVARASAPLLGYWGGCKSRNYAKNLQGQMTAHNGVGLDFLLFK